MQTDIINSPPMPLAKGKMGHPKTILPEGFRPGPKDMVLGRGRTVFEHPGNLHFRKLVKERIGEYSNSRTKLEKSFIVGEIVAQVRQGSPNGGFVKECTKRGRWYEVGDFLARERTSQAFRDALHCYKSSSSCKTKTRRIRKLSNKCPSSKGNNSSGGARSVVDKQPAKVIGNFPRTNAAAETGCKATSSKSCRTKSSGMSGSSAKIRLAELSALIYGYSTPASVTSCATATSATFPTLCGSSSSPPAAPVSPCPANLSSTAYCAYNDSLIGDGTALSNQILSSANRNALPSTEDCASQLPDVGSTHYSTLKLCSLFEDPARHRLSDPNFSQPDQEEFTFFSTQDDAAADGESVFQRLLALVGDDMMASDDNDPFEPIPVKIQKTEGSSTKDSESANAGWQESECC